MAFTQPARVFGILHLMVRDLKLIHTKSNFWQGKTVHLLSNACLSLIKFRKGYQQDRFVPSNKYAFREM